VFTGVSSVARTFRRTWAKIGRQMTVIALEEARKASRRRVLGMALIRSGDVSVSCVIRNLTDAGGALDVGPQGDIPDRFTLIVLESKKIYSCNVVWRKNRRIGVLFCRPTE
jgi:hypothetical protein